MKSQKKRKLKSAGWRVGNAREFLDLTSDESVCVEIKLAAARRRFHCRDESS